MSPASFQDTAGPGPRISQQSHSPPSGHNVSSRHDRQDTVESDTEAREDNGSSKAPPRKKQRKQRPVFSCAGTLHVFILRSSDHCLILPISF